MVSFTRDDYKQVFNFVAQVYAIVDDGSDLEGQAIAIMDRIEECIGQQERPDMIPF